MTEDYYYYKSRVNELQAELDQAKKTIARLNEKLYDIQMVVRGRANLPPAADQAAGVYEILDHIAYIVYDWNKK